MEPKLVRRENGVAEYEVFDLDTPKDNWRLSFSSAFTLGLLFTTPFSLLLMILYSFWQGAAVLFLGIAVSYRWGRDNANSNVQHWDEFTRKQILEATAFHAEKLRLADREALELWERPISDQVSRISDNLYIVHLYDRAGEKVAKLNARVEHHRVVFF